MGWSQVLVTAGLVGSALAKEVPSKTADFPDMEINELRSGSSMNLNSLHDDGKVLVLFQGDPS